MGNVINKLKFEQQKTPKDSKHQIGKSRILLEFNRQETLHLVL